MKSIRQLFRLLTINYVLAKHGLDRVVVELHLLSPLRFIIYLNPWNWFRRHPLSRGEALRKSCEALGPIFVKFGQALSTRPDILPPDIARELSLLQDSVAPFETEIVLDIVAKAYGRSAYDVFAEFSSQPLASASIAQVHTATLVTGEQVVVKVLRPHMRQIIVNDLGLMRRLAILADRYWPDAKRYRPVEIIDEFEKNLLDELDLCREAANATQLRRNFDQSPLLYVPTIYWDYVRHNVMVTERIRGIPVTDLAALKAHGINIQKLAQRGIEIFFTQVLRDRYFHADMHPGNIFVSPEHPENPQYICVDFGIMGTLSTSDQRYLAENLLAFLNRDYQRIAQLHIESGWVARNTPIHEFECAIRTVCEPIFEKPLRDISFALLVMRLFQVARRFHMEMQPQLVLLQKTLFAVEGLGRQLYPELNLWATAKPFLVRWIREQIGPKSFVKHLRQNLPFYIEQLPHMPKLVYEVMSLSKMTLEEHQTALRLEQRNYPSAHKRKRTASNRIVFSSLLMLFIFAGLCYATPLDRNALSLFALGAGLMGSFMAFIKK